MLRAHLMRLSTNKYIRRRWLLLSVLRAIRFALWRYSSGEAAHGRNVKLCGLPRLRAGVQPHLWVGSELRDEGTLTWTVWCSRWMYVTCRRLACNCSHSIGVVQCQRSLRQDAFEGASYRIGASVDHLLVSSSYTRSQGKSASSANYTSHDGNHAVELSAVYCA